ncbi:hypothetical protein FHX59_005719 [Paraburkholderia silvatlantica]|uniref:Uncharacterized protein n=1 Tax=Paraburkholderia silvatlantica TaxID=321895 RepID=A0ABR6FUZ0_9BURK|nr:hypothetical protein [Paraburkholderia silvatlantica]
MAASIRNCRPQLQRDFPKGVFAKNEIVRCNMPEAAYTVCPMCYKSEVTFVEIEHNELRLD